MLFDKGFCLFSGSEARNITFFCVPKNFYNHIYFHNSISLITLFSYSLAPWALNDRQLMVMPRS